MIEIQNQILVKISVGPFEDFIYSTDLIEMKYVEQCGMVLPYLFVRFIAYTPQLLQYLNEGNIVNVSFGRTTLDNVSKQFVITGVDHVTTEGSLVIQFHALLYMPAFMKLTRNEIYTNKTSLEVIQQVAKKHFNQVDVSTVNKTLDKQTWEQNGITDYDFLKNNVWFHSYISDKTFTLCALTGDKFYFKDARNLIAQETPWLFIPVGMNNDSSKLINYSTYNGRNNFGLINNMMRKGLVNHTFDFEKGRYETTPSYLHNFFVMDSDKINFNEQNCKSIKFTYRTQQQSANYNKAYDQNIRNLLMFSNFNVFISFSGQYKQIELLQPATVIPVVEDPATSGTFLIDTICYQIIDQKLWINTTLTKEAPSILKGDNLS